MTEADEILIADHGVTLDLLRVRAFPFGDEVEEFIAEHDMVFVVEQNRDGQMRSLLINELEIDPKQLVKSCTTTARRSPRVSSPRDRVKELRPTKSFRCARLYMTYLAKPKLHHPDLHKNALGFTRRDYEGPVSTLCAGCGHDSISAAIVQRLLRTRTAAASDRQAVRASVVRRRRQRISSARRTGSTQCMDACRRC